MPKLLQINATANWGSTGKIAEQIGQAAMARGWESYIAYGRNCNTSESKLIKIGSPVSIAFHILFARLFDMAGLGSRTATRRLIKKIEDVKPDIIQLHNIHGYYLNYKELFKYLNKTPIPVVWTFHDFWAITGHCAYFVASNCYKWKSKCYDCPLYTGYPSSLVDCSARNYKLKKFLFTSCKDLNIAAISDWVKDCTISSYLGKKSISVIPNGIDLRIFKYRSGFESLIPKDKRFVILGVASQWKERKGFEDYIRLSKLLNDDELIILVGVNVMQKSSLPDNIIGVELLSSQVELAQLYSRADVLLSLSYAETFGMTIVEAAACGTPSIVYDNTAQKSLVTKETGEVVATGDVSEVYRAVVKMRLLGKRQFSSACRARAEKYFDKDKCFEKYVDLYEELIRK